MSCDKIKDLTGLLRDGVLSPPERQTLLAHLATCADCTAALNEQERFGRHIAEGGRQDLPQGLAHKVSAALDAEDRRDTQANAANVMPMRARSRWAMGAWAQAAAVVACVASGAAGWYAGGGVDRTDRVTRDILHAHVRSLLQDNPVQVASSDSHTVRPWFAGKIDIAPGVTDHAAEGFPLIGGRLDVIGETRAGVAVYKHNMHWINVYMWPGSNRADSGPVAATRNGYNMLNWTQGGITHWAVSDVNMTELRQLQGMM